MIQLNITLILIRFERIASRIQFFQSHCRRLKGGHPCKIVRNVEVIQLELCVARCLVSFGQLLKSVCLSGFQSLCLIIFKICDYLTSLYMIAFLA